MLDEAVDRLEQSRWWWVGRIVFPASLRLRRCLARDEHKIVVVDHGGRKVCYSCGVW